MPVLMKLSNLGLLLEMFKKLSMFLNHKKRVNLLNIRSEDEIVKMIDRARDLYLEAERTEDKERTILLKGYRKALDWLVKNE